MSERLRLKPPSFWKQAAEFVGLRQVKPPDICENVGLLYEVYPDLAGDKELGPGNDGYCQSWQGHRGWWKQMVEK